MAYTRQTINVGTTADDGSGDYLRDALIKVNSNFENLWAVTSVNSNLDFTGSTIASLVTNEDIILDPAGTGKLIVASSIEPQTTASYTLGSTSKEFSNVYSDLLTADTLALNGLSSAPSSPTDGYLYYDSGTNKFVGRVNGSWLNVQTVSVGADNKWTTFNADSGSTAANTTTDALTITGGTGITTAISGDTVTISNDSSSSMTFNVVDDSSTAGTISNGEDLKIAGGTGITTAMAGDTLTITNSNPTGLDNIVEDTTPELGGALDTKGNIVSASTGYLKLGAALPGSLASRTVGIGAYFNTTSDNSQRHYSTGWANKQTLTANVDTANKKQGWAYDSTLDIAGYTHGAGSTDSSKNFGDYHYVIVTNSDSSAKSIGGITGAYIKGEIDVGSTGDISAVNVIGLETRASADTGGTTTNLIGIKVNTDKGGSTPVTNRYSIFANNSDDTAKIVGPLELGDSNPFTFPTEDGTANQVLKTNGSGALAWVDGGIASVVADTTPQLGGNLDAQAFNITTTGKILYSNLYAAEGDLPSASTYHGMFAHVHATGKGYFAHAGNWVKLANEADYINIADLKTLVAASSDFADYQSRIAAL